MRTRPSSKWMRVALRAAKKVSWMRAVDVGRTYPGDAQWRERVLELWSRGYSAKHAGRVA